MWNWNRLIRTALFALPLAVSLESSLANAVPSSSSSFTLTSGGFVASGPLSLASSSGGGIQLLSSSLGAGASGQSQGPSSGIVLSSGWAMSPIPVPEPGFAALLFSGLVLLPGMRAHRKRRADGCPQRTGKRLTWGITAFLLLAPAASYAIPHDVAYQGTLADSDGDALEGPVDIGIALFEQMAAFSGEVPLYSEDHIDTALGDDGSFSLLMGTGSNTVGSFEPELFQTNNVYLEITVEEEILSPRQPISSVPWALVADELADAPNLLSQVGDLESQLGSFPVDGDIGSELASLSSALSSVQATLGTMSASTSSLETQLAAAAGHIAAVSSQLGTPVTSSVAPNGGTGLGLGIYLFSMSTSATGNPLLVHINNGNGGIWTADPYSIRLTVCDDPSCASSSLSPELDLGTVDSWMTCTEYYTDPDTGEEMCMMEEEEYGPNPLEFPQVATGSDGLPVITYLEPTDDDLKFIHCGNATCSAGNTLRTLVSVTAAGWGSDLAIGGDGLPIVSYYDTTHGFMILHCLDLTCTSVYTHVVDGAVGGDWDHSSSITAGADGLAVAAYYDGGGENLGFARCSTASCTSTSNTILDSAGDVGLNPAIAIGSSGYPSIAYHDATESSIHLITCGDATCSEFSGATIASSVSGQNTISLQFTDEGTPIISWTDATSDEVRVVSCPTADCSVKGPEHAWIADARDHALIMNGEDTPIVGYLESHWLGDLVVERLSSVSAQLAANETSASGAQDAADAAQTAADNSQTAANNAQSSANTAQADIDGHHTHPGCTSNHALSPGACPFDVFATYNELPNCSDAQIHSICEGDGECGTDVNLDNCPGGYDVYYKSND
ncbi:MAG: hypothetical protein VCC04_08660 [Myxococcota bacterium]